MATKLVKTPTAAAAAAAAPAAAKTPATKTVAKSKPAAAAGPAVETPELPEAVATATPATADDMIAKVAHEVENLGEEKAFKLVPELLDSIDQDGFKLGGVLAKVQAEGWFMNKGHETFRAWVEAECGIAYRKSMYLIQIYNDLVNSGIEWAKVKHLGWTKLKELSAILSPDNVDGWVALAESVTVLQLIEAIKNASKGSTQADAPAGDGDVSSTTTMTFKLHTDQKTTVREALDKAKLQSGTEFDSVAIEHIALDFLGSSPLKTAMTLEDMLKSKSIEEVLGALDTVFPNVVIQASLYDTVEEAVAAKAELQAAADAAEAAAAS